MATKLHSPVTRETTQRLRMRPVVITLSPPVGVDTTRCTPARPEHIEVHLKGTQQRWFVPMADFITWVQRRDW